MADIVFESSKVHFEGVQYTIEGYTPVNGNDLHLYMYTEIHNQVLYFKAGETSVNGEPKSTRAEIISALGNPPDLSIMPE